VVPAPGTYNVQAVGVRCDLSNFFSGEQCTGHNEFVEVDVNENANVPTGPVTLRYSPVTAVLTGTVEGEAGGVRAVRTGDGATAFVAEVGEDGSFAIGLAAGTWRVFARAFVPNVVDGPPVTVVVDNQGANPASVVLEAP
jgi:hypothetical protein